MKPVLISIAIDVAFRKMLDEVARGMGLEDAYHLDEYVSRGDMIDYGTDSDTLPLVFIALDPDPERAVETAEILSAHPGSNAKFVFASREMTANVVRKILLDGKATLLPLPASLEEVRTLVARLNSDLRLSTGSRRGKLVVFLGINGGAGTTTLATHTARGFAERGKRTLVVDARRHLGHAGLYLGISRSRGSIWDLAENQARLDDSLLDGFLVRHPSGLDVICSTEKTSEKASFSAEALQKVLEWLRSRYEVIVVDGAAGEDAAPALASAADQVLFVASAEVAPLRDLARWAESYGGDSDKFEVVVSHLGKSPITARHFEETAHLGVAAALPEMNGTISAAINAGKPVEARARNFYRSIDQILDLIEPHSAPEVGQKSSWLSWSRR